MELHILDCSNYIYAGTFSKQYISRGVRESNGAYQANEAPIGGVRFLLRQINNLMSPNAEVMPVFDRYPEIKHNMYKNTYGADNYKGTRGPKDIAITAQQRYAEDILRDVGFNVQAADGFEADDVIYSLVKYFKEGYDHIYIHTKDSDLFFLVDKNVSIAKVGDKGNDIDIFNYRSMVKKGEDTLFNTVHLRKLCRGDTADNIPGVGWEFAEKFDEVVPDDDYAKLGDLDLCRKYIKDTIIKYPTMHGAHEILSKFNILCPLDIGYDNISDYEVDLDMNAWSYYMSNWDIKKSTDKLENMLNDYIEQYYE